MWNLRNIRRRIGVRVEAATQMAKHALQDAWHGLQPIGQRITHSKLYRSIYRFGKALVDEYRLMRYGAETLEAVGYHDKPHDYTVLPLLELLELQQADRDPRYQQFQVGELQVPASSLYLVIAEYRYCYRIFVGAVEELKYANGKIVTRGSAPLVEFIRPIDGYYNSWNIAYYNSTDERLELAVATALSAIAPTDFNYTSIRRNRYQQPQQQENQQEIQQPNQQQQEQQHENQQQQRNQ